MILALLHLGYRWLNRDKIGQLFIYAPLLTPRLPRQGQKSRLINSSKSVKSSPAKNARNNRTKKKPTLPANWTTASLILIKSALSSKPLKKTYPLFFLTGKKFPKH
jgi:hypothetical protein